MLEASSALDEDEDIGADDAAPVNRSWRASGHHVGVGWCRAEVPSANWSLKGGVCGRGAQLKVLTYNLFWWNLYGQRGGNWGSASRLIADNGPFDIMGFQECDDPWRVLNDGGLGSSYNVVSGHHATAIAYNKSKWHRVDSGLEEVAEDRPEQHWGRREVGWARLRSKVNGKVVFVVNHHGPLPVNTGGICGGEATAYQILKVFGTKARESDFKLLLGDLNAENWATTQATLGRKMHRAASNWVDAVFASCPGGQMRNLGNGGSDHDALSVVLQLGPPTGKRSVVLNLPKWAEKLSKFEVPGFPDGCKCHCDWAADQGACKGPGDGSCCWRGCCGKLFLEGLPQVPREEPEKCICDWAQRKGACVGPGDGSACRQTCCSPGGIGGCLCAWAQKKGACNGTSDGSPCHEACCNALDM